MPIQGPIPFPPKKRRRSWPRWPLFVSGSLVLALAGLTTWIACDWSLLMHDTPKARARWTLVLAGEGTDAERTTLGLNLLKEGRTDSLLISGTPLVSDIFTSSVLLSALPQEIEIRRRTLEIRHTGRSTAEEAQSLIPALRELGADTVLLVTSDFHTRRAASIFNRLAPAGMAFLPVAAPNPDFRSGWSSRDGAKFWLLEWSKTLWWNLVDRWSSLPLRPQSASLLRYPETGRLGAPCPACPAPVVCPPAPACPQVAASPKPEAHRAEKPKEKPKAEKKSKDKPRKR